MALYLGLLGPGNFFTAAGAAVLAMIAWGLCTVLPLHLCVLLFGERLGLGFGIVLVTYPHLLYLPLFFASFFLVLEHQWALFGVSRLLGRKPFEWVRWAYRFANLDFPFDQA